ncbi:Metallo-hydrolase/oxidoreductase [Neocallimastix californiae]|uniref:Metallo-hydrolase/oxidoreductase n=1 Tax=Neocallimastix californiae TaxID=1754190 RepID=A0A1Y2ETR8_9FUNG|nr:Metallo-hydrolase/oxidoreductase [Neocallimastix californiae]|eukprot:ORY74704.1 Metallo-hydrolase/oxidoreductase [Neocallimastix californiae]
MANTIDLTFLGTSSAQPSVTRSHSSLVVRINGTIWLFDAGEGVQRQLMYSTLKLGKINKIFITHMHGDHIYGLPGLVCTLTGALNPQNHMEMNEKKNGGGEVIGEEEYAIEKDPETTPCLEIYGPEGLRDYLRCALMYTYSRLPIYYRVHELILPKEEAKEIAEVNALDKEREKFIALREKFKHQIQSDILHPDELLGEDIQPDADGYFRDFLKVEKKYQTQTGHKNKGKKKGKSNAIRDKVKVSASYIKHSVPALGYVLEEHDLSGNIKMELVQPPLLRNKEALAKQGIKQPLSLIRNLKNGENVELPDGTVLIPDDVITPTEQRKIVILGDTYNPSKIIPLAENPTILVHEATNMYEGKEDGSAEAIQASEIYRQKVMSRGHSTPEMAGAFAAKLKANTLILNHFSSRYASLNHIAMIQPGWGRKEEEEEVSEGESESESEGEGEGGKKVKKKSVISNHHHHHHQYYELKKELKKLTIALGYPFPENPPKRDLLSEEEKKQLKMKDKQVSVGEDIGIEINGEKDYDCSDSGSGKKRGILTFAQQKLLKDWEIMEKIRSKAASTFQPSPRERIILADDFLQIECNRTKTATGNATTTTTTKERGNNKRKNKIKNKENENKNENKNENENENENGNENKNENENNTNNKTNTKTEQLKPSKPDSQEEEEEEEENDSNPNESSTTTKIPIYMAWNQTLI